MFLAGLGDFRRRWLLVVTLGAAAAGVAAGFAFTAAKRYQATAVIVVAPVAPSDPTLLGIDVLHDSSRHTAASTAAQLVVSPQVAEAVRVRLGLRSSRASILHNVHARVNRNSDAVEVVATDADPARAAQIANGFVDAFIAGRTAGYQSEIVSAIRRVQGRIVALPPNRRLSPEGVQLQRRLADLQALIGTSDPTVRHGSEAVAPASASWPHPVRWTILGALIGLGAGSLLALGLGMASAARRKEPAVRREYDSDVPERIVAELEQRLAERIEQLAEEQRRLAAREASLAVREREISAKIDELRAASAEAAPSDTLSLGHAEELARREEVLDERVRALTERERALARRAAELERRELEPARASELSPSDKVSLEPEGELARREQALEERVRTLTERERTLARKAAELERGEREQAQAPQPPPDDGAVRAREEELERREQSLDERVAALTEREVALAREAADLRRLEARIREAEANVARRAQDATAREAELAEIEEAPAPESPPPPPPAAAAPSAAPEPAPVPSGEHGWHLADLERLVSANAAANPERVDEWQSYLFYLRDYADVDGRVPTQFEWLIEDTFGDLLAASR